MNKKNILLYYIKKFNIVFKNVFWIKKRNWNETNSFIYKQFFKFIIIMKVYELFQKVICSLCFQEYLKSCWVERNKNTSKIDDTALKVIFGKGNLAPYFFPLFLLDLFPKYQCYPI